MKDDFFTPQVRSKLSLADLLTVDTSLSIFYSYARELELSSSLANEKANLRVTTVSGRHSFSSRASFVIRHQGSEAIEE